MCRAVCSANQVLLCAVGAVLRGCRWCVTTAVVASVGHSSLVLADSIHGFGAVGDLFPGMLDGEVVHSNVSQFIEGCLEWLCHKFPKELSLMVVCMDDMAMQFMLMMLIIDHLAAVHQCLDACNKILGVLSWPGHNIFEFSKMHIGVDIMCHSLLDSVKEGRSFCLGRFLFLFAAGRHPLCMHLQGFGSLGSKDVSEVVLTVWWDVVEEEPVLQGMPKYGGVIGILGVPVVDGQSDGCCPSCQCTSDGISCGLGRLGDVLLWSQFSGHVSCARWSDNGQIWKKQGGGHKSAYILRTIGLIYFKLEQGVGEGMPYH